MVELSNVLMAKVASRMRSALVMDLVTSNKEAEYEEEAITIHRKRGLKSGKNRNADASILHKVVWPHKVV